MDQKFSHISVSNQMDQSFIMSWFVLVKVQVFWKANKIWRKSQFLIFWQLSKCQNKWGTFFKFCCLWLLTTSCPLILHLLVDFPFGIFLWLPYKICTSNFKMLIEDGKIKNPWIWIQTNLFFIKWIEKKVENIIQSKKFELCCFFVLLYVQPHEILSSSFFAVLFFFKISLNFGRNLRYLTLVTWQEDWQP